MTPPTLLGVAERGEADDRDGDAGGREHRGRVADREVVPPSAVARSITTSVGVLGRAPRGAALRERQPAQLRIVDPVGGDGRGSIAANRLAVGTDELGDAPDLGNRGGDAVDRGDLVDHRLVDEAAGALLLAADAGGVADDDVGAVVGRREGVAEPGLGGVAEDHRPGEEGDAEHDGDAGAEEPPLAAPQRLTMVVNMARSASERLDAVEDPGRVRAGHRVDDAAVGEEQHGVGVAGSDRVVGDHHDRLAEQVDGRNA